MKQYLKTFIESNEEKDNKQFDALNVWLSLSKEVQEDFRKRGITKKDLKDAIRWARRSGRKRMIKAIFTDRDGVINHNSKDPDSRFYYILKKEDVFFKDGVINAFEFLRDKDLKIIMITKQRCVSKGLATELQINEINQFISDTLEELAGRGFDAFYVEPAKKDKKDIIQQALNDFQLGIEEVLFIDDELEDIWNPELKTWTWRFDIRHICRSSFHR